MNLLEKIIIILFIMSITTLIFPQLITQHFSSKEEIPIIEKVPETESSVTKNLMPDGHYLYNVAAYVNIKFSDKIAGYVVRYSIPIFIFEIVNFLDTLNNIFSLLFLITTIVYVMTINHRLRLI